MPSDQLSPASSECFEVRRAGLPGPIARGPRPLRAALVKRASNWDAAAKRAVHRILDLLGVSIVSVVLSPVLLLRGMIALVATGRVFDRQAFLGRFRVPFEQLQFAGYFPGRSLAVLANIARGDMSWTGPRPLSEAEAAIVPTRAWERFRIRPGLVSTHVLRTRVGLAYEDENSTDRDFFCTQTVVGSIGALARALPSAIIGRSAPEAAIAKLRFFGVDIVNTTMDEAIDWIVRRAKGGADSQLYFVNPDCLNLAYGDAEYRRVLQQAERVLPDGIGIHIACRISGTPLVANLNGTDLFPRMCEKVAAEDLSLFLLGSAPGCAEASAQNMRLKFGGLKIAGTRSGYFQASDEAALLDEINRSGADILLVGLGAPRQEVWIANNLSRLRPPVKIGVGGLFDFYSERIARAPRWMREIGMEWSWRLIMEPRRMWRRYLVGNPLFLFRVWRESRLALQTTDSSRDSATIGSPDLPKQSSSAKFHMGNLDSFSAANRERVLRRYETIGSATRWHRLRFHLKQLVWWTVVRGTTAVKRMIDIAGSLILLILLSPLLVTIAILVKLNSRGPVFYAQTRVMKWGRLF